MHRPLVVSGALALLALAPARADAFVRTTTGGAMPMPAFWKTSCAPVTIYLGGFEAKTGLTAPVITKSVAAAAHAWSPDAVTCEDGTHPFLEIVPTLAPAGAALPAIGDDARNVVVFLTDAWTRDGTVGAKPLMVDALAYTQVTIYGDGHISDADILVNAASTRFRWKNFDPGVTPSPDHGATIDEYDLQAALTHEFGHLLGFSHTCVQGDDPAATDDQGGAVPDCGASPEDVIRAVMYYRNAADDATKRVLSLDDERGVCAVYPPRLDPKSCALDTRADGCVVAPARRGRGLGAGVAATLIAGVIGAWRRRRARA